MSAKRTHKFKIVETFPLVGNNFRVTNYKTETTLINQCKFMYKYKFIFININTH